MVLSESTKTGFGIAGVLTYLGTIGAIGLEENPASHTSPLVYGTTIIAGLSLGTLFSYLGFRQETPQTPKTPPTPTAPTRRVPGPRH